MPGDDIGFIARRGTTGRVVNGTAIIGTAQVTTQRHADAIEELAEYLAKTGEFHYITMNRTWRTSTGMTDKFPWGLGSRKPDLIAVDKRGKVHAYEFESGSDEISILQDRLDDKLNQLPVERQGRTLVVRISQYESSFHPEVWKP